MSTRMVNSHLDVCRLIDFCYHRFSYCIQMPVSCVSHICMRRYVSMLRGESSIETARVAATFIKCVSIFISFLHRRALKCFLYNFYFSCGHKYRSAFKGKSDDQSLHSHTLNCCCCTRILCIFDVPLIHTILRSLSRSLLF